MIEKKKTKNQRQTEDWTKDGRPRHSLRCQAHVTDTWQLAITTRQPATRGTNNCNHHQTTSQPVATTAMATHNQPPMAQPATTDHNQPAMLC